MVVVARVSLKARCIEKNWDRRSRIPVHAVFHRDVDRRRGPRALRGCAFDFVSDAGFSKAEVSPSFSPRYAARTMRGITFAFRVFGYVTDEHDFFWRERFGEFGGERVF